MTSNMNLHIIFCILLLATGYSCLTQTNTELTRAEPTTIINYVVPKLDNFFKWFRSLSYPKNSFLGRCFGAAKKLQPAIMFIIFKLGVIVTTLGFLTIFALKSLVIGVLLLFLSSGGLFSKLASLKQESHNNGPQNVHYHVYGKDSGGHSDHYGEIVGHSGWSDKNEIGLDNTQNYWDKLELMKLYKTLGISNNQYHTGYEES